MIDTQAALRFRRLGITTILAVYFVILVGGIVRASGAGMGCPDWPTCFGRWIPPNYHEIYAKRGYQNTDFNPIKTWTEYTNRLIGVTTGFCILLTAWSSRIYLKSDRTIFYLALSVLFLVGFQGWLGSAVVASNLKPLMITLHMLLALTIVALLIYAIARSQKEFIAQIDSHLIPTRVLTVVKIAIGMTLIQIAMGTQVRETVDFIAHKHNYIEREYWRDSFPLLFYVHRSFSSIILFTNIWIAWQIHKTAANSILLIKQAYSLVFIIIAAISAGVALDRLGVPPVAQPIHLLLANLIFGVQFFLYISLKYSILNHNLSTEH